MVRTAKLKQPGRPSGFPLFVHQSGGGRWCKKIRQRFHYFGKVEGDEDGQKALAKWLAEKDDLLAGRVPRVKSEGLTLRELCNRWLTVQRLRTDGGELSPRTFETYFATCERLIGTFGKDRLVVDLAADDFLRLRQHLDKSLGHAARSVEMTRTRMVFKYAFDEGLINSPVRYGAAFRGPGKRVMQKARAEKGSMMLEAAEIRALLDAARVPTKAAILLGVNCGYGNSDISLLPQSALDLQNGWATFPRPKTGQPRRAKLWPETASAVKAAIAARATPKNPDDAGLVFLTAHGERLIRPVKTGWTDTVGNMFGRLLRILELKRKGLNFYGLRRVTETIGGDSRDQVCVDYIMGHVSPGMGTTYRQRIDDSRLVAVSEHIRKWLFGIQ